MTKTVKYYSSEDAGAPIVKQGGWGHIVNLYRSICSGYNEKNFESILYNKTTKIININFAESGHGYRKYQTILIDALNTEYHNEELFILKVNSKSIQCRSKKVFSENLLAASIFKCKVAPLGMVESFTNGAGKSAFKFEDQSESVYLCINDTQPTQFAWNNTSMLAAPSIYMCKNLTELDGGADLTMPYNDQFPNAHKESEWKTGASTQWGYGLANIMYQNAITSNSSFGGQNNQNLNVGWKLIGNGSFHYLYLYINSFNQIGTETVLYTFGAINKKYDYDKNNYIIKFAYNNNYLLESGQFYQIYTSPNNYNNYYTAFSPCVTNNIGTTYISADRKVQYGSIKANRCVDSTSAYDLLIMKGINSEFRTPIFCYPKKWTQHAVSSSSNVSYPNFDGSTTFSKIGIYETGTYIERGTLPGALWIHHNKPFNDGTINKIIDDNNNELYTINLKHTSSAATNSSSVTLVDTHMLIVLDSEYW